MPVKKNQMVLLFYLIILKTPSEGESQLPLGDMFMSKSNNDSYGPLRFKPLIIISVFSSAESILEAFCCEAFWCQYCCLIKLLLRGATRMNIKIVSTLLKWECVKYTHQYTVFRGSLLKDICILQPIAFHSCSFSLFLHLLILAFPHVNETVQWKN